MPTIPLQFQPPALPAITEFNSTCWRQVEAYAKARIAALREENDSLGLTEAQTIAKRARIAELKELLQLAAPAAEVPTRDIYFTHDKE
jgi:hypothetical protein